MIYEYQVYPTICTEVSLNICEEIAQYGPYEMKTVKIGKSHSCALDSQPREALLLWGQFLLASQR